MLYCIRLDDYAESPEKYMPKSEDIGLRSEGISSRLDLVFFVFWSYQQIVSHWSLDLERISESKPCTSNYSNVEHLMV